MNWAKGGSKKAGRSGSIKVTCDYILRDKDGISEDRVGEVVMLNLAADDPKKAWREIQTTIDAAAAIKARKGTPQTGTKNVRPVYAISLSWHPDDKPTNEHMMETARDVVGRLGLSEHQVLIVQHKDRPHAHVHIAANLIHPETGKTAHLGLDEMKLDAWANAYESERLIRSFERAAKFERMKTMDKTGPKKTEDQVRLAARLKLGAETKGKDISLTAKHKNATEARKKEVQKHTRVYRERRAAIMDKYQPILNELQRPKPKAPALQLNPPWTTQKREWQFLARAMKATGMAMASDPLHRAFTRSLTKISEAKGLTNLARKFAQIKEGVHVMAPVKTTPEARKFLRENGRGKHVRIDEVKRARHAELADLAKKFGITDAEVQKKHAAEEKAEAAERKQFSVEAKEAWKEVRERETPQVPRANVLKAEFAQNAPDKDRVLTEMTDLLWQNGKVGDLTYKAKVYDIPSPYCIDAGKIAKLGVYDAQNNRVARYDGGWEVKPSPGSVEEAAIGEIVKFYEGRVLPVRSEQIESSVPEVDPEEFRPTIQSELFKPEQLSQTEKGPDDDLLKAWNEAIQRDQSESLDQGYG